MVEKVKDNKTIALFILLIAVIGSTIVSMYAIFSIDEVQSRCDEFYHNQMIEMNCIDNISWVPTPFEVTGEAWQTGNVMIYNTTKVVK